MVVAVVYVWVWYGKAYEKVKGQVKGAHDTEMDRR